MSATLPSQILGFLTERSMYYFVLIFICESWRSTDVLGATVLLESMSQLQEQCQKQYLAAASFETEARSHVLSRKFCFCSE